MYTHVRILAILHLVFGGLGVLASLFLLVIFGGITGIVGMNAGDPRCAGSHSYHWWHRRLGCDLHDAAFATQHHCGRSVSCTTSPGRAS